MLPVKDYELINTSAKSGRENYALLHSESHRVFSLSPLAANAAKSNFTEIPESVNDELKRLISSGFLKRYNNDALASAHPLDGANLALNINLTAYCNLGCTYCFAEGGDYGRLTGKKLSKDVDVDLIIRFIEENAKDGEGIRFEFFGGEPLMNFDTIEQLCERSVELAARRNYRFIYRVSTNLTTRLTERELNLFSRFNFIVSVSIDGGENTHDRNRPTKSGKGSYQSILSNCYKVREHSENITMVGRMTYVPYSDSSLIEDMLPLYETNIFDWFQILPATVAEKDHAVVYGPHGFNTEGMSNKNDLYTRKVHEEYDKFHDRYLSLFNPDNRFNGTLEIESIIRMIRGGQLSNGYCSGGRNYFTFSPDKSIMPCHRLVGEESFRVGDFVTGKKDEKLDDWRVTVNNTPICSDCSIRYICGGGCKQENYVANGEINKPDIEKCDFQFGLVRSAIKIMANATEEYITRERSVLGDMFVSCGRPTMSNKRSEELTNLSNFKHFRLLC